MVRNRRTREAARAAAHQALIASARAEGGGRALGEALRWLRSEAATASRLRPSAAAMLHARLREQLAALAVAVTVAAVSGPDGRAEARHARFSAEIAALAGAGQHAQALARSADWLAAEAAAACRARPEDASELAGQLAERIARLAASVPAWRPSRRRS